MTPRQTGTVDMRPRAWIEAENVDTITTFQNLANERILRREFVRERDLMRDHDEALAEQAWFLGHPEVAQWLGRQERARAEPSLHDYAIGEDAFERTQVEADIARTKRAEGRKQ